MWHRDGSFPHLNWPSYGTRMSFLVSLTVGLVILIKANVTFASSHQFLITITRRVGKVSKMFSLGAVPTRLELLLASRPGRESLQAPQPILIMLKVPGQLLFNFLVHTHSCIVSFWLLRSELGTPTVSILALHNVVPKSDSDVHCNI